MDTQPDSQPDSQLASQPAQPPHKPTRQPASQPAKQPTSQPASQPWPATTKTSGQLHVAPATRPHSMNGHAHTQPASQPASDLWAATSKTTSQPHLPAACCPATSASPRSTRDASSILFGVSQDMVTVARKEPRIARSEGAGVRPGPRLWGCCCSAVRVAALAWPFIRRLLCPTARASFALRCLAVSGVAGNGRARSSRAGGLDGGRMGRDACMRQAERVWATEKRAGEKWGRPTPDTRRETRADFPRGPESRFCKEACRSDASLSLYARDGSYGQQSLPLPHQRWYEVMFEHMLAHHTDPCQGSKVTPPSSSGAQDDSRVSQRWTARPWAEKPPLNPAAGNLFFLGSVSSTTCRAVMSEMARDPSPYHHHTSTSMAVPTTAGHKSCL
eukprot:122376-Chlamydomonas_euryale.AAC.3